MGKQAFYKKSLMLYNGECIKEKLVDGYQGSLCTSVSKIYKYKVYQKKIHKYTMEA